jgi:hypothetical protein
MKSKYKKFKKAIWASASTGVVTGLILMGTTNTALAETFDGPSNTFTQEIKLSSPMHAMRHWNSPKKAGLVASSFGLDPALVASELKDGKGMKQILQENGISTESLGGSLVGKKSYNKRMWKQGLNKNKNNI